MQKDLEPPGRLGPHNAALPTGRYLIETIRFLAQETGQIDWTDHALEQMDARGICDRDVLRVLRIGDIRGGIRRGEGGGEWKVKVAATVKGTREVGVVTVVCGGERLIIVTAEWEDPR